MAASWAPRKRRIVTAAILTALALAQARPAPALEIPGKRGVLNVRKGFRFTDARFEGNRNAYLVQNPGSDPDAGPSVSQTLQVDVDMEVLPRLSVRGRFDDAMVPSRRELAVRYEGERVDLTAGDIVAGFAGTEFPMESQNLFGVKSRLNVGGGQVHVVAARTSGAVGHFEGRGDRTKGPYFLPDRHIVEGSERVILDGRRVFRGADYTLDARTGVINFSQPVDDRFRIVVDYEYESGLSLSGEALVATHVTGSMGDTATFGLTGGRRGGGLNPSRALAGLDGRVSLPAGVTLGGEVARALTGEETGLALRVDGSGRAGDFTLGADGRLVDPGFSGLGSVLPTRDQAQGSVHATWSKIRDLTLTGRLSSSLDNLRHDLRRPRITEVVADTSARYLLRSDQRMELTVESRLEGRSDDRTVPMVDTAGRSLRGGVRYRLEHHLLSTSLEVRRNDDRSPLAPAATRTVLASLGAQSRLPRALFVTTGLTLGRTTDAALDTVASRLVQGSVEASRPWRRVRASGGVTLAVNEGPQSSMSRSATVGLSTQGLEGLYGEVAYQLKDTLVTGLPAAGDSVLSLRGSHQRPSGLSVTGDVSRRMSGPRGSGPLSLELRSDYRLRQRWEVAAGMRLDQLLEPPQPKDGYRGRTVWGTATMVF